MIFIDLSRSWRCLLFALLCCASALNHCQQYSWKCVASLSFFLSKMCVLSFDTDPFLGLCAYLSRNLVNGENHLDVSHITMSTILSKKNMERERIEKP